MNPKWSFNHNNILTENHKSVYINKISKKLLYMFIDFTIYFLLINLNILKIVINIKFI